MVDYGLPRYPSDARPSKFVAKIASDMDKPNGLTVVPPDGVREFLDPLPIKKMWGSEKQHKKLWRGFVFVRLKT